MHGDLKPFWYLVSNNYTLGSSKGDICVLNHKQSISMVTTLPIVNKAKIIAQLLLKMWVVNTRKIATILAPLEYLPSEEHDYV